MKEASPDSNARRAESSSEVDTPGGAACTARAIVASASSVSSRSSSISPGPERIDVPADSIIALAHTTRPS
jgi:hypothetical protein